MKPRHAGILICCLLLLDYTCGITGELVYCPRVVYRGDYLTLFLKTEKAEQVSLEQNGETLLRATARGDRLELNHRAMAPGKLVLHAGDHRFEIVLLSPHDKSKFRMEWGQIRVGTAYGVLLPEHRYPPPENHRGQVARVLLGLLYDRRPQISSYRMLLPNFSGTALPTSASSLPERVTLLKAAPSGLEAMLNKLPEIRTSSKQDLIVLAVCFR
ncbi:MAG: hypothetical protein D6820_06070, partial [Lentisphaerae bacterium]